LLKASELIRQRCANATDALLRNGHKDAAGVLAVVSGLILAELGEMAKAVGA
jgi:hypothetical protein